MKKILRKNNNQGSSLALVMVALLIIGVAVVSFQTSIASFVTRTMTQHYEKQAYLSARSVAESVAKKLEEDTYHCIMQLSVEERKNIIGLPQEMGNAPQSEIVLTPIQVQLLENVQLMKVNDIIDLGEIEFQDYPEELEVGQVFAKIQKSTESRYIIEAKADVKGEVEAVKAVLNAQYYELVPDNKEDGMVEIDGNWSGFYTDFGLGPMSTGEYTMNDQSDQVIVGTASYHNVANNFQGSIYSKDDITLDGVSMSASNRVSSEGSVTIKGHINQLNTEKIVAREEINVAASGRLGPKQGTISKALNITGNNVQLSGGPYVAETINIIGDNVSIFGEIRCDTLYVKGNNIQFGEVYANTVEVDCGINGNTVNWKFIRAQKVTIQEGVHGWVNEGFFTPTGEVTYGAIIYGNSEANGTEIPGSGYKISVEEVPKLVTVTADLEEAVRMPYRTKPEWASYEQSEVQWYEQKPTNQWPGCEQMESGYYYIADTVGAVTRTENVYEDGVLVTKQVTWNELDAKTVHFAKSGSEKIYIIVRKDQNLKISNDLHELDRMYFILEENAKLYFSKPGRQYYTRVYGASMKQDVHDAIQSEIATVVEKAKEKANYIESNINYSEMQLTIDQIMEKHWSKMSGVILGDGTTLKGSVVVPYIKLEGKTCLYESTYPYEDNPLGDEDASVLPEGAGGSSGGDTSNPSGGSSEIKRFILLELEAFTE